MPPLNAWRSMLAQGLKIHANVFAETFGKDSRVISNSEMLRVLLKRPWNFGVGSR